MCYDIWISHKLLNCSEKITLQIGIFEALKDKIIFPKSYNSQWETKASVVNKLLPLSALLYYMPRKVYIMFIVPYLMREGDECQGLANFYYTEADSRQFSLCNAVSATTDVVAKRSHWCIIHEWMSNYKF